MFLLSVSLCLRYSLYSYTDKLYEALCLAFRVIPALDSVCGNGRKPHLCHWNENIMRLPYKCMVHSAEQVAHAAVYLIVR